MIKKFIQAEVRSVSKEEGIFEVIASSGKVDRMGDTINPNGWYLKNYKKNPVILWSHSTGGMFGAAIPPVGKAEKVWVENGKELKIKGKFADTPFAQELKTLVDGGFLSAVSVGFLPLVEDIKGEMDIEGKMYRRANDDEIEKGIYSKEGGNAFDKQELLELSWVSVPALPQALISAKKMNLELVTKALEEKIEEGSEDKEPKVESAKTEEAKISLEAKVARTLESFVDTTKEQKEESETFEKRLSAAEKVINELREAIIPKIVTPPKDETKGRKALTKKKSKKSDTERLLIMFDKVFETLLRKLRQND